MVLVIPLPYMLVELKLCSGVAGSLSASHFDYECFNLSQIVPVVKYELDNGLWLVDYILVCLPLLEAV